MPSSLLSHNFPGFILKIKYPDKINAVALIFGTFVPDLNVFVEFISPFSMYSLTHSIIGLFVWTIPLSILATILFCKYIGPYFSKIASKPHKIFSPLRYFGVDKWSYLRNHKFKGKAWLIMIISALIGGITHFLLDLPSHADIHLFFPWIIIQNPDFLLYTLIDMDPILIGSSLINRDLTVYRLLWSLESLAGAIISLYYLRYITKNNLIEEWYSEKIK